VLVAGAGWLWALLAAPATVKGPVAWGGGAAAIVIIAAVTAAAYFAEAASRARRLTSSAGADAELLRRDLAGLSQDTLPVLLRRVRDGAPADGAVAGAPVPESEAVRSLLEVVLREAAATQRRTAAVLSDRTALADEVETLSGETLPAMIARMRAGEAADSVIAEVPRPASPALAGLLETVAREVGSAELRGAAAMAACASAAARIQAQTTRMLAELREMENQYGDDKVLADLMELDHRASQLGRLADSVALLAGGRSGRRWTKPIAMESILRGAMGRIDSYQRIRLHSTSTAAVVGYAAEGVMHALAELMDNAAAFSAHGSEVHVYVEDEDAGAVLTIEDSGLGMRKRERSRAEDLVSQPFDLTTLPGTRLGLAVVGRLASRYGLSVNFRPSSRGGTGVVVMIPRQLIAAPRPFAGASSPAPAADVALLAGSAPADRELAVVGADTDAGDLPKRPPGVTLAEASRSVPGLAAPSSAPSNDAGSRFAAFRQAGGRRRTIIGPDDETS
jgi:signal transduction histidine kinase